ncbi:MAG: hypothetical protein ACRDK2_12860 [Solirubrobacteraceae bacterium]
MSARLLMLAGGTTHVAYGAWSLLEPESMVRARYAPNTHGLPEPRLLLRAFGGHLLISGCLALAATRSPSHARSAAALCMLINTFDVTSAVLELHARGGSDETLSGGIVLSGSGALAFAAALRALAG